MTALEAWKEEDLEVFRWVSVGKHRPCTVCGGTKDCEMAHDQNLMLCKYTESEWHWGGGFLHHLYRPPTALEEWLKRQPVVIRFGCSIRIPSQNFSCHDWFKENPQKFLQAGIEGSVSNIYTGPPGGQCRVVVRYHPNVPTI